MAARLAQQRNFIVLATGLSGGAVTVAATNTSTTVSTMSNSANAPDDQVTYTTAMPDDVADCDEDTLAATGLTVLHESTAVHADQHAAEDMVQHNGDIVDAMADGCADEMFEHSIMSNSEEDITTTEVEIDVMKMAEASDAGDVDEVANEDEETVAAMNESMADQITHQQLQIQHVLLSVSKG